MNPVRGDSLENASISVVATLESGGRSLFYFLQLFVGNGFSAV